MIPERAWEDGGSSAALPWLDDQDSRDLRRWVIAATIVFGIHAAALGSYLYLHGPELTGDLSSPIDVDLAPSSPVA